MGVFIARADYEGVDGTTPFALDVIERIKKKPVVEDRVDRIRHEMNGQARQAAE